MNERTKNIASILPLVVGIAYVMGYFVSTNFLGSLFIPSDTVLQSRFLIIGLVFLCYLLLPSMIFFSTQLMGITFKEKISRFFNKDVNKYPLMLPGRISIILIVCLITFSILGLPIGSTSDSSSSNTISLNSVLINFVSNPLILLLILGLIESCLYGLLRLFKIKQSRIIHYLNLYEMAVLFITLISSSIILLKPSPVDILQNENGLSLSADLFSKYDSFTAVLCFLTVTLVITTLSYQYQRKIKRFSRKLPYIIPFLTLLLVIILVSKYSSHIYPVIPKSQGGGLPESPIVSFTADQKDLSNHRIFIVESNSINTYMLLDKNDLLEVISVPSSSITRKTVVDLCLKDSSDCGEF